MTDLMMVLMLPIFGCMATIYFWGRANDARDFHDRQEMVVYLWMSLFLIGIGVMMTIMLLQQNRC
jgi:hypothetical protein